MPSLCIQQFINWSSDEKYVPVHISTAQGRRFSELTKISVDMGLKLTQDRPVDHIVFSSRHGEINSTFQLMKMMGQNEVLSPMLFSQSVHNTAIGSYALITKNHAATTALSGGEDSFMMGLVSCAIYLQENPKAKVLYLAADEKVPVVFEKYLAEENQTFVGALILTSAEGTRLQFDLNPAGKEKPEGFVGKTQAIEFADWYGTNETEVELRGSSRSWNLKKC